MKNDRLRVPVDPAYLSSIGLAVYAFARLEWDAIYCCERMSPGFIHEVRALTAGQIAVRLVDGAGVLQPSPDQAKLLDAAKEFQALVRRRNDLVHANPGTDGDGSQRLFRDGRSWSPEMIDDVADEFTACSIRLNELLQVFLKGSP